jgi:hypothetical protein
MAARLAGIIAQYGIAGNELSSTIKKIGSIIKDVFTGGDSIESLGKSLKSSLFSSNVVNYKVDAPMVYKSSPNLKYKFDFDFACKTERNAKMLYALIDQLRTASCPDKNPGNVLEITPPNLFEIRTEPVGLFHIKWSALTSMDVTVSEPFYSGKWPHSVKLGLEFMDVTPLYKGTFSAAGTSSITTGEKKSTG